RRSIRTPSSEVAGLLRGGKGNPMADRILDVRNEIPRRRHELIFEYYDALGPGEAFMLVNDHDPKPLYYQFDAEHTDEFTWEYTEERSEEHTSELQSRFELVCRLLLEKKKIA